jgi:hypothetical protein
MRPARAMLARCTPRVCSAAALWAAMNRWSTSRSAADWRLTRRRGDSGWCARRVGGGTCRHSRFAGKRSRKRNAPIAVRGCVPRPNTSDSPSSRRARSWCASGGRCCRSLPRGGMGRSFGGGTTRRRSAVGHRIRPRAVRASRAQGSGRWPVGRDWRERRRSRQCRWYGVSLWPRLAYDWHQHRALRATVRDEEGSAIVSAPGRRVGARFR